MTAYSRPDVRAVLDDATLEAGRVPAWGWLHRVASRYAAAAADAAADDADDADADDADAILSNVNRYWRTHEMRQGLVLVQVPGRYWGVTRVGWAVRVEGDEWELLGATTVVRTGNPVELATLAEKGPGKGHRCGEPGKVAELLHRFSPRRVLVADEAAWARYVGPKPAALAGKEGP